ncbi:MAG: nuclear transport factor 2 family protein [Deltaproteobacteria bacterium]|jgi:hypothetical protein|nr:nuclear transport factor 2 family protein [Deltaproteobacteria bacterium]
METTTLRNTWDAYAGSWKLTTAEEKRARFKSCLSPACVYRDPLAVARGWDELVEYMMAFHQQIPGGHFVTERFIAHHGRSMAAWKMMSGDGVVLGDGVSYGEYDEEGRLISMNGFYDVPAGAPGA